VLASCAGWNFVGAADHPALRPGVQLATFERGRGAEHERLVEIRADGRDVAATTVDRLLPFVRPPTPPQAAIAYSDIVRRIGVADAGVRGVALEPDRSLTGTGSSGRYSALRRRRRGAWTSSRSPFPTPVALRSGASC